MNKLLSIYDVNRTSHKHNSKLKPKSLSTIPIVLKACKNFKLVIPFLAETMVFFVLHEHGNDHLDFFFLELLGTDSSDGVDDAKADSSYQHS